jgi:glucokinase
MTSGTRAPSIVGLDVGGTKTAVVEIDAATASTRNRIEFATESHIPFAERIPVLIAAIDRVCAVAQEQGRTPIALSVSIGGPLRIESGVLLDPPHLPGWHHAPVKAVLRGHYPELPVYVEHDGNAGALAEFRFGVGRDRQDLRDMIFLTAGTGLGAGVIANGALIRGASDSAGEVGFLPLAGRLTDGTWQEGTWDYLASGSGLLRHARTMHPERFGPRATIRGVVDAARADDACALTAVERTGEWLGRGLALVVTTLNPQLIVVGTLGVLLGDRLFTPARRALAAHGLRAAVEACEIVPAALGARIGDVAAAMAALEALPR